MVGTELASVVVELAAGAAAVLLEVFTGILLASARSWRYLVSPPYREQIEREMSGRGRWYRWIHMTWGVIALLASVLAILVLLAFGLSIVQHPVANQPRAWQGHEGQMRTLFDTVKQRHGSKDRD